jgi:hypothetical protein
MFSFNHALVMALTMPLIVTAANAEKVSSEFWEKDYEIAVAKSAGPEGVSEYASVWVLAEEGYERAVEGTNGFNCLVMRRWGAGFDIQKLLFETPGSVIAPICYDPIASGAPMQEQFLRAELGLKGKSHDEIRDAVLSAYESGKLKALEGVAFAYMYSAAQRLGPNVGAWHPHVMVYAPGYTNDMLGGAALNSGDPVIAEAPGTVRAIIAIPVDGQRGHIEPAH